MRALTKRGNISIVLITFILLSICSMLLNLCLLRVSKDDLLSNSITDYSAMHTYFASKNIIFTGLVKDAADTLPALLLELEEFAAYFNHSVFILFESNSQDDTPSILRQWSATNTTHHNAVKIILTGDHLLYPSYATATELASLCREDRYALYRNFLLDYVKQYVLSSSSPTLQAAHTVLAIIDLDIRAILNHGKSSAFILNEVYIAMHHKGMNLVCLNGLLHEDEMRDSFATVDVDNHWFRGLHYKMYQTPMGIEYLRTAWDIFKYEKYQTVLAQRWTDSYRFLPVKSCFGGAAFYYSLQAIMDTECRYLTWSELQRTEQNHADDVYNASFVRERLRPWLKLNRTCEHIPFHFCLFNHGLTAGISTYSTFLYY